MNSVNELFRALAEIAALVISLAVLAVILQSPNTSSVISATAGGFEGVLGTAENINSGGTGTGVGGHFGLGASGILG